MAKRNPALFYFWAHSEIEELDTPTMKDVVAQSEIIFREFTVPKYDSNFEILSELERDLTCYSQTARLSKKMGSSVNNPEDILFLAQTKGTNKKYMFERTMQFEKSPGEIGLNERQIQISRKFLKEGLYAVKNEYTDFLKTSQHYHGERELAVANQIDAIQETVAVFFGAGHPKLERLVAEKRPTRVYFPYPDYKVSFDTQLNTKFDKEGVIDWELFLKARMEEIARAAVRKSYGTNISQRELDLASVHYANIISGEKVKEYQEFLTFAIKFNQGPKEVFDAFLKRERLPAIEKVVGRPVTPTLPDLRILSRNILF